MPKPIDLTRAQGNFAARILVDTCEIKAIDLAVPADAGEEAFDEGTGTYGPAEGAGDSDLEVYGFAAGEGDCAVFPAPMNRLRTSNDGTVYVGPERQYEAYLPLSVVDVKPGHVLKVTASRNDPALVGRFFTVGEELASTLPIARLLQMREITEGEQLFGRW